MPYPNQSYYYPTVDELEKIATWSSNFRELMAFVKSLWWAADWGWQQKSNKYYISTGGWSGNESLIQALEKNFIFWTICWEESRRGGHYCFEIPEEPFRRCELCFNPSDGPMLIVGEGEAHAACTIKTLRELLDPDWQPGRESAPLPKSLCGH